MTQSTLAEEDVELPVGYRYRWWVMVAVIIADVMDLLDSTITSLAGPSIRADIGGSESTLQWILAAYTLTFSVGLISSARAGDIVGRKQMFVIGMIGFTVFSLACGLAPTAGALITFRALQGLFGAVMLPHGFAMVKQSFKEEDLQKAFIPFGPIMGLMAVLGPILAGFLIDANIFGSHWRSIFLINVPVGIVGAYVAVRFLPRLPTVRSARLDPLGSLLVTVAAGALIYPLVQGRELGWPAWTYAMIAAAVALFGVFAWTERRSEHPVIEPSLFRKRGFVAGVLFLGSFFLAMSGLSLVLQLYMQYGLGYKPSHAAIVQIPYALGISIGAALGGAVLGPKLGRLCLHIGLVVTVAAMAWYAVIVHGGVTSGWDFTAPYLVAGLGSGLIFAPLFDIILASLDDNEVGTGSGLLNAMQQFSGSLGVAVIGTLFFNWLPRHGFNVSTAWAAWVTVGAYALSFVVAFGLPRRSREGGIH